MRLVVMCVIGRAMNAHLYESAPDPSNAHDVSRFSLRNSAIWKPCRSNSTQHRRSEGSRLSLRSCSPRRLALVTALGSKPLHIPIVTSASHLETFSPFRHQLRIRFFEARDL